MKTDIKGAYIPAAPVSRLWDSQYNRRAVRNLNRLNVVHLVWTVAGVMKGEIDDEMEGRGLNKGEYRRWSRQWESEFDTYLRAIEEVLIKENVTDFCRAYEELDGRIRDLANLERRTRLCWGRLHMTVLTLTALAKVSYDDVMRTIGTKYYFCRRLMGALDALNRSGKKWLSALDATGAMPMKELPVGFEEFTTQVLDAIYGKMREENEGRKE